VAYYLYEDFGTKTASRTRRRTYVRASDGFWSSHLTFRKALLSAAISFFVAVSSARSLASEPKSVEEPMNASERSRSQAPNTFRSSDGTFRFQYSDSLVACPSASCDAYFPMMCNQEGSHTIACFAYDKNRMKDYPEFEAATFSVAEIADAASEHDCLSIGHGLEYGNPRNLPTTTIHGATFTIIDFSEGGMGHGLEAKAYRRFYRGKCYQLTVRIATHSSDSFSEKFQEEKLMDVREHLDRALNSFQFTK
jgi:hypothetical protein